jgi:NTE family protein
LEGFGADLEYNRLLASWTSAHSIGADTLLTMVRGGSSFGDDMPYYDKFALGGFLNLSGYANEQFRGDRMIYANLIYSRRLATLSPPMGRGLYVGGSLEYGYMKDMAAGSQFGGDSNTLHDEKNRFGGSVFFGADTWLGPFYLGWGLSGEGRSTAYVLLGQP